MNDIIIEMKNIKKSFGEVKAITEGQFQLKKGEIHSLIGENGAGKSTMMKILYGLYEKDEGEILLNGKVFSNITPETAIKNGIGMVHQEFMLVNQLTVLENIILGFEPNKSLMIDYDKARDIVGKYISDYKMDIQPNKKIEQISLGEAQRVEIIKTLYRGADVLILDEPTAVLTPQETDKFFEILKELKKSGKSIVFISHKLDEVMEISDRITVMRQGKFVDTVLKKDTNKAELAKMMVGREVFLNIPRKEAKTGDVILEVKDLWTSGNKEISKIRGISLDLKAGEILGIAGIDGNGQSELIEAITGLRKIEKGTVNLCGKDITNKKPKKIREMGLSHIPEDRNVRGLNRGLNIQENLIADKVDDKRFSKGIFFNDKAIKEYADGLVRKYDIRPQNSLTPTSSMSGGNAQKVVVAREVENNSRLLIASQPSRGVDIGAIESIRKILNDAKEKGTGILLVSADLEEIMSLSDRIIVMFEGKISGQMLTHEATSETLGLLMLGGSAENGSLSGSEEING